MKNTNDDIEEPVKKSWMLLFVGILVLTFTIGIGIFLLVEAFQKPKVPEDVLDMKRMMISGFAVVLFSLAIIVFLVSMFKPAKKKSSIKTSKRPPVKRKGTKRKTR